MPLQVDTAFKYVNGKTTEDLTLSDLKIDSPYNTYVYRGYRRPRFQIQVLKQLMAAVTPITTDYFIS
jgi:UPF0755 protein